MSTVTKKGEQILRLLENRGSLFASQITAMRFKGPPGPVLGRLKTLGFVIQLGEKGKWELTDEGKKHTNPLLIFGEKATAAAKSGRSPSAIHLEPVEAAELASEPVQYIERAVKAITDALTDLRDRIPGEVDITGVTVKANGSTVIATVTFAGVIVSETKMPGGSAS